MFISIISFLNPFAGMGINLLYDISWLCGCELFINTVMEEIQPEIHNEISEVSNSELCHDDLSYNPF